MNQLIRAIENQDVMTFERRQVEAIRHGLELLQEKFNPPDTQVKETYLHVIMELDELFEKWQRVHICDECKGTDHQHYLSCSIWEHSKRES